MTSAQPAQPVDRLSHALVQAARLQDRLAVRHRMLWGDRVPVTEMPLGKCWAWFNLLTKTKKGD